MTEKHVGCGIICVFYAFEVFYCFFVYLVELLPQCRLCVFSQFQQGILLECAQQLVLIHEMRDYLFDSLVLALQFLHNFIKGLRSASFRLFQFKPLLSFPLLSKILLHIGLIQQFPLAQDGLIVLHYKQVCASWSIPYNHMSNKPDESPQEILKRIETENAEKKRERTLQLLQRKPQGQSTASELKSWWNEGWQRVQAGYSKGKKNFQRMSRVKENRHLALMTIFLAGALWVTWQVQEKYDKLRRRARSSKSMKEKQIQSENQYINRMLAKNPFRPVPIQEEEEEENAYIYQKADIEFDTRADLMQVLQEEKKLLDQDEA